MKKLKRALIAVAILAPGSYVLGDALMSKYGLDPPYVYFEVGLILKMMSILLAVIFVALTATLGVRLIRNRQATRHLT
jgi:Flp pilus assembly pilin Flp